MMRALLLALLLIASPAWGALTVRYADFDLATGLNDGTSEANAWRTWTDMTTGMAAGQCINIQQTASRDNPGADITISTSGTNTAPIYLVGYKTTAADCSTTWGDALGNSANAFQTGAGGFKVTFSGDNYWVIGWDWSGSNANDWGMTFTGDQIRALDVSINNSAATSFAASFGINSGAFRSTFASARSTGTGYTVNLQTSAWLMGCRVDLTGSTTSGAEEAISASGSFANQNIIAHNLIRGPDALGSEIAIDSIWNDTNSDDIFLVRGNSIRDFAVGIDINSIGPSGIGNVVLINNVMHNVAEGVKNNDSTNAYNFELLLKCNAIQADTTDYVNLSGKPFGLTCDKTLTADPFTDTAWDMSLNATAGGGALCRDLAEPIQFDQTGAWTNALDIGALQNDY